MADLLDYLFHHLFLPRKLPGEDDDSPEKQLGMIDFVKDALSLFEHDANSPSFFAYSNVICMLEGMRMARDSNGYLHHDGVREVLRKIEHNAEITGCFHITAQNAGLLIGRSQKSVNFEVFELSPTNKAVMETRGRLVRQFPATAIAIPITVFRDEAFQSVLSNTLITMSHQEVDEEKPKVTKSQQLHVEDRDTTNPRIVTELLTSMLRGIGKQVNVTGVCKNTYEEVMWEDSEVPWRRSPVWLFIRVSLQLTMSRVANDSGEAYKRFMVFLFARVLELANKLSAPSSVLHPMATKISRRLLKLTSPGSGPWLKHVQRVMSKTSDLLDQRWKVIREQSKTSLDLAAVAKLDMDGGIDHTLPELDKFLSSIQLRETTSESTSFHPVSFFQPSDAKTLRSVDKVTDPKILPFHFARIESWVAIDLDNWIEEHAGDRSSCGDLSTLLQDYHRAAKDWYASRPEGVSRMLLTTLELWIAADKAAIHAIPMLRNYDPEVPSEVFQALLLGLRRDMDRLYRAETYLMQRKDVAKRQHTPSVFRSYGHIRSFPVRYYLQSPTHQQLMRRIFEKASLERREKVIEFRALKERHAQLMKDHGKLTCEFVEVQNGRVQCREHAWWCQRCSLLQQAENLSINVHEWPLCGDTLKAQTTVFELDVPPIFGRWRDVTLYLIDNVLQCGDPSSDPLEERCDLQMYHGLSGYVESSNPWRVRLSSNTKSHMNTHRRSIKVGFHAESDVLVNNGLHFNYLDSSKGRFIATIIPSTVVSNLCTLALPEGSQKLRCFLVRNHENPNGETPNEVIASQFNCLEFMSLSEYKALAVLPYGYSLQWMSILTQLAMPTVDFNKEETATFLFQMGLQAGPYAHGTPQRPSHVRLSDKDFGSAMLDHLRANLMRIEENWESHTALGAFTFLTARLLPMVTEGLQGSFFSLLQLCRDVSYKWLKVLDSRLQDTTESDQRIQFQRTILDVALICVDSFHVDDEFLQEILSQEQQSSILVEASIIIHNNATLRNKRTRPLQNYMYDRWTHVMHRSCPIIGNEVLEENNPCLSLAVRRCWPAFNAEQPWNTAHSTWHWFETTSAGLKVHINILNGDLLVNGLPLSRLPEEYEKHSEYQKLFGCSILDVMPSPLPGLKFCSTKAFEGHTLHFGMQTLDGHVSCDILVRMEKDGSSYDLIPPRVFASLLPNSFVEDFAHWYHHSTQCVEFRPLNQMWVTSPNNWSLKQKDGGWVLTKGETYLLSPGSAAAKRIAGILSPLEAALRLHMLYDLEHGTLQVKLPYLQLDFHLNRGKADILSRQFRGMQISKDQSIGALVGLKSKLILHDTNDRQQRIMVIPKGVVKYRRGLSGDHVEVSVRRGTACRVQRYSVDEELCRLVDNNTLQSKLYLAYLHAVTSYCLPDPLTHRTGTEQAISILTSASIRSAACLSGADMSLLGSISDLSPGRSFYPQHLRVMQTVSWSPHLSPLTQDGRFHQLVKGILDSNRSIGFLYPGNDAKVAELKRAHIDLVNRDVLRSSRHCVSGFGASDFTIKHDEVYGSRDCGQGTTRAMRASETADRICNDRRSLAHQVSLGLVDHLYQLLSAESGTSVQSEAPPVEEMSYNSKWLRSPKTFMPSHWCRLQYAFQNNQKWLNEFQLMAWLTTLSYASGNDDQVTQALSALAHSPALSAVPIPVRSSIYELSRGYEPDQETITSLILEANKKLDECPEDLLPLHLGEEAEEAVQRRKTLYQKHKLRATEAFRDHLIEQWPCCEPHGPMEDFVDTYVNVHEAMDAIMPMWKVWFSNLQFRRYLEEFVHALRQIPVKTIHIPQIVEPTRPKQPIRLPGFMSDKDLFSNPAPSIALTTPLGITGNWVQKAEIHHGASSQLAALLNRLTTRAEFQYERRYVDELVQSHSDLVHQVGHTLDAPQTFTRAMILHQHLERCDARVKMLYKLLSEAVQPLSGDAARSFDSVQSSDSAKSASVAELVQTIVETAKFWPRVSPVLFLQQLKNSPWSRLSESWKKTIVAYGTAISILQQAKRLVQCQDNEGDLLQELQNLGHQGWDVFEHPEWLLLECESGIMIREVQQKIAREMINPLNGKNSVMQLNMGEGKSSVIVPIVSAALSNNKRLVRVIVAKPQAKQMHQMLLSKLSNLLDRPIYHFPFSRAIRMDIKRARVIRGLIKRCMDEGGVMLVQPEHLLSFQLMGLDGQISKQDELANELLAIQRFLNSSSRDVIDESDENLSVKFELIYTLGQQRSIEHSPDRWNVIQQVLTLFREFSTQLFDFFPQSLEIEHQEAGKFPRIRILRHDVEEGILNRVAKYICDTGLIGFPVAHQPAALRKAMLNYITNPNVLPQDVSMVEGSPFWNGDMINHILLLRGLVSGGILGFCFREKRWRVNYGIDPNREVKTKLAVPFRAKDSPTPRSEFSHPDVVIVLTCLSYYYGGLDFEDIFSALQLLTRSDNANVEYEAWVKTAPTLPSPYRQLKGVNLRDRIQCNSEVFPHLAFSKGAIDYFLSRMVFAKESKEFPHKLSASGWDLGKARPEGNPTTGFSGTNDSRYVLPLDVHQLDLADQNHTNALVLNYLLRPENSTALVPSQIGQGSMDSEVLLKMVAGMSSDTRVILDVGAQVIDLTNLEFAQAWLKRYDNDHTQAVIFFNENDELTVLDRSGNVEELQTSPFSDQLDQCLVFLDEAHTRGTDLKLPANYQAAVTLGANLTKDRLVQACMRMRKLGHGQGVVFCIPKEIEQKILRQKLQGPPTAPGITIFDVLCWVISETWVDLRKAIPLWANQGLRFHEQKVIWDDYRSAYGPEEKAEWASRFLEDEAQSLDSRYRPRASQKDLSFILQRVNTVQGLQIQRRCQDFGFERLDQVCLQEEQERELSPETERERQVELPPAVKAFDHEIHPNLRRFIRDGQLPSDGEGFKAAFRSLRDTSAAAYFDVNQFPCDIWVTNDFASTVLPPLGVTHTSDLFQRPVQWVLTSNLGLDGTRCLVIISPFEAQSLLESIQGSKNVTLHLYSPRNNLGFQPLDRLSLYTVPPRPQKATIPEHLIVYLNLFAGQLYISSFPEYMSICDKLGLAWSPSRDSVTLEPDGFIPQGLAGGTMINRSALAKSPVKFMKVLMTNIRQNCESIEKTHIGKILEGVILQEDEFDEVL